MGPEDWLSRYKQTQAAYCEVWYNVLEPRRYREVFSYIQAKSIHTGLHFWGTIAGKWEPNIAHPKYLEKTLNLIKLSIDEAAKHQFSYVNIHCGNRKLIKIDLQTQLFLPDDESDELPLEQAETFQQQSLLELTSYATNKGILLLVETIPANTATQGVTNNTTARLQVTSQYSLPVASIIRRAEQDSIFITNDFCHTFADEFDKPLETLWQALWSKTTALEPFTKLLHINTVIPPHNGTDSHHGITTADFKLPGIFPTRDQYIELLKFFKTRDDVWAINEPSDNHVENYRALVKLISEL